MAKAKTKDERRVRDLRIKRLSRAGKSRGDIARRMGVSYDTVRLVLDPEYREVQRARKTPEAQRARANNSLGQWLIEDDGIIDEIAVAIAISGTRKVRLTWSERERAAMVMLARGTDIGTLKEHLGMSTPDALALIRKLGARPAKGWHKHSGPTDLMPSGSQTHSPTKKCLSSPASKSTLPTSKAA